MTEAAALYQVLKDRISLLTSPLFEFAQGQVSERGQFLPFGASMRPGGQVVLHGAAPAERLASGTEVLPILHDGLRVDTGQHSNEAIAVCEWVNIQPAGERRTDAIKVLVEHVRGFCGAFYMPCRKRLFRAWQFGDVFVVPAEPEVRPWGSERAT